MREVRRRSGDSVQPSPSPEPGVHSTDTPSWLRMSAINDTSASLGTLLSVSGSSVRRHAAISGSAAFLAPLIGISPFRRAPPRILIRSMKIPDVVSVVTREGARIQPCDNVYLCVLPGFIRALFGLSVRPHLLASAAHRSRAFGAAYRARALRRFQVLAERLGEAVLRGSEEFTVMPFALALRVGYRLRPGPPRPVYHRIAGVA